MIFPRQGSSFLFSLLRISRLTCSGGNYMEISFHSINYVAVTTVTKHLKPFIFPCFPTVFLGGFSFPEEIRGVKTNQCGLPPPPKKKTPNRTEGTNVESLIFLQIIQSGIIALSFWRCCLYWESPLTCSGCAVFHIGILDFGIILAGVFPSRFFIRPSRPTGEYSKVDDRFSWHLETSNSAAASRSTRQFEASTLPYQLIPRCQTYRTLYCR